APSHGHSFQRAGLRMSGVAHWPVAWRHDAQAHRWTALCSANVRHSQCATICTGTPMSNPTTALLICLYAAFSSTGMLRADNLEFNRDIRPILAGTCFTCHGPDASAREAELRLDQIQSATA